MAKEICISSTPHETRLAILEDDQLAEIYYERENEYTLAGSIYNGRVTRVLPGMQSAFVDLGLERDAFLYVTDFMELEDQEETDELERAAASGANQPPREVHRAQVADRTSDRNAGRSPERAPEERGPRSGQPRREAEPVEDAEQEEIAFEAPVAEAAAPPVEAGGAPEQDEPGGRRWRGRRRRRGRGQNAAPEQDAATGSSPVEMAGELETAETLGLAPEPVRRQPVREPLPEPELSEAPARTAAPAFVLPGESLSKYGGGAAADETPRAAAEAAAPPRPIFTSKPSTLIETPLVWDGSGLLPGESLSRHRERPPEPVEESLAEETLLEEPGAAAAALETIAEVEEEREEPAEAAHAAPLFSAKPILEAQQELEFEFEEESFDPGAPAASSAPISAAPEAEFDETVEEAPANLAAPVAVAAGNEPEDKPEDEPESGASASFRIDPAAPKGFRLFGFGKKKEELPAASTPPAAPASRYAPGVGHVEEEVIEGEEIDAAPHGRRHKREEPDFDNYTEETHASRKRPARIGEADDAAHSDRRAKRSLDEANDDEGGEEETATPGARPARSRDRRDRGPRGRGAQRRGPSRRSAQTSDLPIISELLKPGQEILVQIAKEPIAKKGARITSHIALPGRFLVFMPTVTHVGVSRKIASDEERHRLKRILLHERGESTGGLIVRTAAEGASEEELRADLRFLMNLWNDIKQRSESSKSPALIYHDLSLIERILRDQVSDNFSNIWVDSEADYERIVRFLNRFSPSLVRRVKLYTKQTPLFEHFGIEDEISKALRSKVWLKSGGSIVINQTEALVAIDINTGKYVGKSARLEDTILKTNLDAVPEIVRQIRLRDLGGIIVIDFIDMDERKNRFRVMAALEEALKSDRAPTKVLQFNDFGLVAITRKRVKQSLERTLSVPCPTCQATGMVKSPATVCNEIYVELRKMRKHFENADVMLRVHPETVKVLKGNNSRWLNEFEELTGRNLLLKSDPALHPEQFDIQG